VEAVVRTDTSWLRFIEPSRIVQATDAASVGYTIATVEQLTSAGSAWAVGFVTYEAAAAYGLRVHAPRNVPLAWFAIFDRHPERFDDLSQWCPGHGASSPILGPMRPTVTREAFEQAFNRIKERIAAGDTYQANYTFRLEGRLSGESRELFANLARSQRGRYSAFIRTGDLVICSASPELFFRREGRRLIARPMKGTAPRGRTLAEDRTLRDRLRASTKERAENVMIVDMMRNDVGRVASVGTVSVPELFTVERYPTVWQMTSEVTAETDATLDRVFAALHPSASVTGAPKVSTMEILAGLEPEPRGVYTGAVGYIAPGGDAQFNVAIRTAVVDEVHQRISFGVGSGIVWDSTADAEYEECLLKAAVLGRSIPAFELLETLRWSPEAGFDLLERHLQRMRESAEYFEFECDERRIREELSGAVAGATGPLRVRLRVSSSGVATVESTPVQVSKGVPAAPVRLRLSTEPVSRDDVFLYHKTTNRGVYDRARRNDADDVCLWNDNGEVTESTIANIVVELPGGVRVTPPVACGLLAGTLRADLLERGEIRERVVRVEELSSASRIWLINSVQGWRPASLVG
jgi:para-aminobenzoate synthetase/4-amino-4-deoxychorismate lyase